MFIGTPLFVFFFMLTFEAYLIVFVRIEENRRLHSALIVILDVKFIGCGEMYAELTLESLIPHFM